MELFDIVGAMIEKCSEIWSMEFHIGDMFSFTLWDVAVIAAITSGAGLILAAGMGED